MDWGYINTKPLQTNTHGNRGARWPARPQHTYACGTCPSVIDDQRTLQDSFAVSGPGRSVVFLLRLFAHQS